MTYWKAQKEQHLRQLAHLFEGDPGGGKFNGQAQPFVLQAPEKNLFAPIRDEVLLYFNGHLPGADGRLRFWRSGGKGWSPVMCAVCPPAMCFLRRWPVSTIFSP